MNGRLKLGLVAGAAALLSTAPLSLIFTRSTWMVQSVIAVALITGAATLARWLRAPVWAQLLGMLAGLLIALTWMFPSGAELLGVIPMPGTFAHFAELANESLPAIRHHTVPVPDVDPLLFATVLGIGLVAVIIDLLAVGLRRPALAGLPMLALYSVPVAVYTASVSAVPFVIAAVGYLWLLVADNVDRVRRFGRRFTGDGRDVDLWAPSPLAAAGRRLAVVTIAVAALLPVAVPGMTNGLLSNFNGLGGAGDGTGGGTGRVNLFAALSGQLRHHEVQNLVKVTTTEPEPFYLRFGVADVVRTSGFSVRSVSGLSVTDRLPDRREAFPHVPYEMHRADVEITSDFNMALLPIYADLLSIENVGSGWLYNPDTQTVFSYRHQSKGKKYSFTYLRPRYTATMLAAAPTLRPEERAQFADQIVVPQVPEVNELVARLVQGKKNDYERVRAIYDYFSRDNGFVYRLSTEGGTSGQDIVNFLTNKAGFCQQYAAAMAWMVRAAGIPARVAFGFTNGTDRNGNTYTLTNRNLHAWTEVHFVGLGWVPFDPTPAAAVPGSHRSDWAPDVDAPETVVPSATASTAPGTDDSAGPTGRDPRQEGDESGLTSSDDPAAGGGSIRTWWAVAGVVALSALLAAPAMSRIAVRRRRYDRAVTAAPSAEAELAATHVERARADTHAAWAELTDTLLDFRFRVSPSETPRATIQRLVEERLTDSAAADAARLLGHAEERARYARGPLAVGQLREALRIVRRALQASADRRTRMLATVFPPSVLLRWRSRILDGTSLLISAAEVIGDRMARLSPRRLFASRSAR